MDRDTLVEVEKRLGKRFRELWIGKRKWYGARRDIDFAMGFAHAVDMVGTMNLDNTMKRLNEVTAKMSEKESLGQSDVGK